MAVEVLEVLLVGGGDGDLVVQAQSGGWLAVRFTLRACPAHTPKVDAITLRYRVLGIATSERIPLWRELQLNCRPAAPVSD